MKGRLLSGDSQDQSVEGGREMGGSSLGSGPSLLSWGWEAGIGPLIWEHPSLGMEGERSNAKEGEAQEAGDPVAL